MKLSRIFLGTLVALLMGTISVSAQAQSRFLTVLNGQQNQSDSVRSVSYYDADNLDDGPLFSVYIGNDEFQNNEDPVSIDVDPATGDIYVAAFDSGFPTQNQGFPVTRVPSVEDPNDPDFQDTNGDIDIYKIPFATTFYNWQAYYQGKDVRNDPNLSVGGFAPVAGYANATNLDYVLFGDDHPSFDIFHANTARLSDSIVKIGEVKRNEGGGDFFDRGLEFIDQDTLLLLSDSIDFNTADATTDHGYRIVERVSTSPGLANDAGSVDPNVSADFDFTDGGFNNGPAGMESWNSTRMGLVNLDFDPNTGLPFGHSEPGNSAYYTDGSVRGVWVTDDDGPAGGDDLAFLDIDASTKSTGAISDAGTSVYRRIVTQSGGVFDSTVIFDDPNSYSDPNATPDGKADAIFVDNDGNLIVVESGFLDGDPNGAPLLTRHQPAVYKIEVVTYNDPNGNIVLGDVGPKFFLDGDSGFMQTPGDDPNQFLERGIWSAYDPETNTVYMANPGGDVPESPTFGLDVWSINVDTGVVTSHLDLDDSIALFGADAFGDDVDFFTVLAGDFNGDGVVDGADFLAWQRGESPNNGSRLDLIIWEKNYGSSLSSSISSSAEVVPEPTSIVLLSLALGAFGVRRQRRNH